MDVQLLVPADVAVAVPWLVRSCKEKILNEALPKPCAFSLNQKLIKWPLGFTVLYDNPI